MKDVDIKAVAGVRNDIAAERFGKNDLAVGVNIDIDESGKVSRRKGLRQVAAGADVHSLAAVADAAYFVDGDSLFALNPDFTKTLMRDALTIGRRMAYLDVNNAAYFMNGVDAGVVEHHSARRLGISVPATPGVAATSGDLLAGTYGVTMTYVREDGVDSGAPACAFITLGASSGITLHLSVSDDPKVTTKRVYVTEPDGAEPYLVMTLDNDDADAVLIAPGQNTVLCSTQFMSPMPAGDVLGLYNGRLYVAVSSVLFYSEPYAFELCDMRSNYIPFDARVTLIAPVTDGMFVGTEKETMFLKGGDPSDFEPTQVSAVGSVFGTLSYADAQFVTSDGMKGVRGLKGTTPMWATVRGVCAGSDGGVFTEITCDRYVLPAVSGGASTYRYQSGMAQFLTTFF